MHPASLATGVFPRAESSVAVATACLFMNDFSRNSYGMLHPGIRYRVVQPFLDFDRVRHMPGEMWTFLGYSFLPYEDGLSLFVLRDHGQQWQIRMQLGDDEQGSIVSRFEAYLERAG